MDSQKAREILKKVRQIEIRTRRLVESSMGGEYHSVFKGRGMDFDEVREYVPGDEVRTIDWNVTARSGRPFVKKFTEERELTILLLVDVSASGNFGSTTQSKREMAAELASVLAFSAIRNSDKVGLILFSDQIEQYIPPKKGRRHVLRVVREILYFQPKHRGTDIVQALDFANRVTRRRAISFLISDFQTSGDQAQALASLQRAIRLAQTRHDLVAMHIQDRREHELPNVGLLAIEDAETGEMLELSTANPKVRARFAELSRRNVDALRRVLNAESVDSLELETGESYIPPLMQFFKTANGDVDEISPDTPFDDGVEYRTDHGPGHRADLALGSGSFACGHEHGCVDHGPVPAPVTVQPAAVASQTTAEAGDIHDIRGPISIPYQWLWAAYIVGGLTVAASIYALWRWLRRNAAAKAKLPFEIALERLEAARALMAPDTVRDYAFTASEIIRVYIEQRFGEKAAHRTTDEFLFDLLQQTERLWPHTGAASKIF